MTPASVSSHLDFVSPTKRFPSPLTVKEISLNIESYVDIVTPSFLRSLYQLNSAHGSSTNNMQGIASFLEQYFNTSDLGIFWTEFNISNANVTRVPIDQLEGFGVEAELDVQCSVSYILYHS